MNSSHKLKAHKQPKQHNIRVRVFLLCTAIGVFLYTTWLFFMLLTTPSDQTGIFLGRQIVVTQVFEGSPLRMDDVILRIGEQDVTTHLSRPGFLGQALFDGQPSGRDYTILRDGQELQVYVPWQRPSLGSLLWRGGGLWLFGFAEVITAFLLVSRRGEDTAARLLAFSFLMVGLNQVNNIMIASGANVGLAWAWLFIPLDALGVWFGISFAFHTALIFPEVKAPLRWFPWLPWLLHAINPLTSSLVGVLWGGPTLLGMRATMFDVANPFFLVQLVLQVWAMGHTYATSKRLGVRNQIRWIFWGVALSVLPWILLYMIPSMVFGSPWLPLALTNISLVLIPVTFTLSVFRYRLMDIDFIINRTLVYGILTSTLVIVYFALLSFFRRAVLIFGGSPNDLLAAGIATLGLFFGFNPLRLYTQRFIDRVFYRDQLDFAQILREISQELSSTLLLRDLRKLLTEDIAARLGLSYATLLLRELDDELALGNDAVQTGFCGHVAGQLLCIENSALLRAWFSAQPDPLVVYQARHLSAEILEALKPLSSAAGELCLPLFHHNELLGLYVFGSKLSGNLLRRDEVNTLVLLGHQAAASIQNARLYAVLQDHNRSLEARVQARTVEVQSERNRLDTILQNIADGLVVTDRNGYIVLVNSAFSNIIEFPSDHVLGSSINQIITSKTLCDLIANALRSPGAVFSANLSGDIAVTAESTTKMYKASACALIQHNTSSFEQQHAPSDEGVVLGVVTVLRDITHEQEVDRMKTEFISTVSHELRTPLTSVMGFAKLIRKTFYRDVAPKIATSDNRGQRAIGRIGENLDIITTEGERLTRLINDVLDIAKMEAGKTEWHIAEVPFLEIVRTSIGAISVLSVQKGVPVQLDIKDASMPVLLVDRDRMVQVMTNLLSNALKFTDSGVVRVSVKCVNDLTECVIPDLETIFCERPYLSNVDAWLWVRVSDTGIGIPESKLPEVFEKFKQVSDTLADRPQGTGLGLPICREIIERHKGHIWVESEVDRGSVFSFVIPLSSESLSSFVVEDAASSYVRNVEPRGVPRALGSRILVVDDEAHIRSLLHQELVDAGYQVIEAVDGMAALDKARSSDPDLILLDIMIPRITGFDVVSVLKGDAETARIPIVILSALEDRERGFRLGADGYLTKPIDTNLLLDVIQEVLSRIS